MKPIIINQCDQWQSYESFKLVGVFINYPKMMRILQQLIIDNKADFDQQWTGNKPSVNELQNSFTYLNFNEVEFNEDYS